MTFVTVPFAFPMAVFTRPEGSRDNAESDNH